MKKIIFKILQWSFLLAYLIIALSFTNSKRNSIISESISIKVLGKHDFLNNEIVENLLNENKIFLDSVNIANLDFNKIEEFLENIPYVKNAEVYNNLDGGINIELIQRNPVMRVITEQVNLYIDEDCNPMPLSENYTAQLVVLTGNLENEFFYEENKSTPNRQGLSLLELFNFVNFLNSHDLWASQVEQIYINENGDIELVPRLGNHVIILGNLENYEYKLKKIETLYLKGFNIVDWEKYSIINLKYSNQVICKKR
ncbi:MAG: hypothetical protein RBR32_12390 [Bacteroidales bacterium]|nr:hypothetical protein [Bacteroidales bacterium]